MKNYWFGLVLVVGVSCMKGKQVDLIVHNAKIHCMDDQNTVEDAMAIKDGKIIEIVDGNESCVLETMAGKIRYEVSAISFEMSAKLNSKPIKK